MYPDPATPGFHPIVLYLEGGQTERGGTDREGGQTEREDRQRGRTGREGGQTERGGPAGGRKCGRRRR
jgi:hypothetical protein